LKHQKRGETKMNMPGFSAEYALAVVSYPYEGDGKTGHSGGSPENLVYPARELTQNECGSTGGTWESYCAFSVWGYCLWTSYRCNCSGSRDCQKAEAIAQQQAW
jgi:hypothetical protein